MAESIATPPTALNLGAEDLAEEWRFWIQRFDLFATASGISEKPNAVKVAVLLNKAGDAALKLYNEFQWDPTKDEDKTVYEHIRAKFEAHCVRRKSVVFARHQFFSTTLQHGESVDAFVLRLRQKARICDFRDQEDSLIRDRVVLCCPYPSTKECLLGHVDITLEETCNKVRAAEASKQHMKSLAASSAVDAITAGQPSQQQRGRPKFRARRNQSKEHNSGSSAQPSSQRNSCSRCGTSHQPRHCPAYNTTCTACQKPGHFASVCRSKSTHRVGTQQRSCLLYTSPSPRD